MDKEMELLLSEKEIKFNDKTVVVKRLAFLDSLRLATQISTIAQLFMNHSEGASNALFKIGYMGSEGDSEQQINTVRVMGILEFLSLIGEEGTEILKNLIAKSTNLTEEEVESVDCVDGIDLIFAIYEVNKGFFTKCLKKLKEKMPQKANAKKTKSK